MNDLCVFGAGYMSGVDNPAAKAKTDGALLNQLQYFTDMLRKVGIPEKIIVYCLAQIMLESADFTSNLAYNYNNYSGIRYVKQKAANGSHNGFATYSSPENWAADYKRVLSLSPAKPINASSAQAFYLALQANHYFTPAEATNYSKGFNAKLKKINQVLNDAHEVGTEYATGQKTVYVTSNDLKTGASAAANDAFSTKEKANELLRWAEDNPGKATAAGVGIILALSLIFRR